jgi:hypothetical protein
MKIKLLFTCLAVLLGFSLTTLRAEPAKSKPTITLTLNGKQQYNLSSLNYNISTTEEGNGSVDKMPREINFNLDFLGNPDTNLLQWAAGLTKADGKIVYINGNIKREFVFKNGAVDNFNQNFYGQGEGQGTGSFYLSFTAEEISLDGNPITTLKK